MPQYTVALILMIVFAVQPAWFPTGGMYTAGSDKAFGDLLHHLVLPALTASLVPIGLLARMFRVVAARRDGPGLARGAARPGVCSRRRITGHVVHNSMPPMLTIAGLQFGYLLSGVVFVETIFSWPGLGCSIFQSISQRDVAVIQAGVLVVRLRLRARQPRRRHRLRLGRSPGPAGLMTDADPNPRGAAMTTVEAVRDPLAPSIGRPADRTAHAGEAPMAAGCRCRAESPAP